MSSTDRQCNPRLFGDGFVPVTLAAGKRNGTRTACCPHQSSDKGKGPHIIACTCLALPATRWQQTAKPYIITSWRQPIGRYRPVHSGRLPPMASTDWSIPARRDRARPRAPSGLLAAGARVAACRCIALPPDAFERCRQRKTSGVVTCLSSQLPHGPWSPAVTESECHGGDAVCPAPEV
jgi:hypothetical protein